METPINLCAILLPILVAGNAAAAVPPRVDALVAELTRPGCPSLFDQLTPSFQRAAPRPSWTDFCASIAREGKVRSLVEAGGERGFAVYHLTLEHGDRKIGVAFDAEGRISGLFDVPWPVVAASVTRFRWPLDRTTLVFWGGPDRDTNTHANNPRQRRAMDLDVVAPDGQTHKGDGRRNEDYASYGAEVLAAAAGRVVVVVDGFPTTNRESWTPRSHQATSS